VPVLPSARKLGRRPVLPPNGRRPRQRVAVYTTTAMHSPPLRGLTGTPAALTFSFAILGDLPACLPSCLLKALPACGTGSPSASCLHAVRCSLGTATLKHVCVWRDGTASRLRSRWCRTSVRTGFCRRGAPPCAPAFRHHLRSGGLKTRQAARFNYGALPLDGCFLLAFVPLDMAVNSPSGCLAPSALMSFS